MDEPACFVLDLQERLLEYLEKWTPGEMVLSTCDKVLMEEPGLAKVVTTIGCLSKEATIFLILKSESC